MKKSDYKKYFDAIHKSGGVGIFIGVNDLGDKEEIALGVMRVSQRKAIELLLITADKIGINPRALLDQIVKEKINDISKLN